jgi:hypothetical protein
MINAFDLMEYESIQSPNLEEKNRIDKQSEGAFLMRLRMIPFVSFRAT